MSSNRFRIAGLPFLIFVCAAAASSFVQAEDSKRLLLIGQGPDGHPPATHEFMAGVRVMEKLLAPHKDVRVTVTKADEPWSEGPALIDQADGVVMFVTQGARWIQNDPQRHAALKRLAQRKGGIVALHWAVGAHDAKYIEGQLELLGGTRGGPQRKYKVLETDVTVVDRNHPITTGVSNFRIHDEFYYRLDFVKPPLRVHPLLTARIDDNDETACWSWERPDGGRSFGFVAIHFHSNWQRTEYRRLVVQGILWTLGRSVPKTGVNVDLDPKVLELK
ncbi:MAG: ThuA domain-containing protein [Verrucomicrobia bacterium]|nr:ThuA domain-containing protein [Verrucomicrobiota bacterium]